MSIHWPIVRACLARPRSVVFTDDRRVWRRGEVLVAAMNLASEIEKRSQAETVGVMLPTSGAFGVALLAGWLLGRRVVPLNYLLSRGELEYVIKDAGLDAIVTAGVMLEHVGFEPDVPALMRMEGLELKRVPDLRVPPMKGRDDVAVVLYTSGTSGKPKGVLLTHGNLRSNVAQMVGHVGFTKETVLLGVLPQFHSFGLTVLTVLPMTLGNEVVYTARFSPQRILGLLREHKPSAFIGIPSMYAALLKLKDAGPADFRSVVLPVSGGEPLPAAVREAFFERFRVEILEGYGLTETSPVTNVNTPTHKRAGTVGRLVPGVACRIVDEATGRDQPVMGEGEIRLKGPNIMKGYHNLPRETAAVFDGEGYFRTGDMGRLDADGYLSITGRIKEMMIVGGENVFPREIEEVLAGHDSVHAVGVAGITDPVRGELPVAFVELSEGAVFDEKGLIAYCRGHLAGYKVPRAIYAVEALPRNPTGKVVRRRLGELLAEG